MGGTISLRHVYDEWLEKGDHSLAHQRFNPAVMAIPQDKLKVFTDDGWTLQRGKVRDVLWKDGAGIIYHTDKISAGDRLVGVIPLRGVLLNMLASYWYMELTEDEHIKKDINTHWLRYCTGRIMTITRCRPFAVEIIARGYRGGSFHRHLSNDVYAPYEGVIAHEEWDAWRHKIPEFGRLPRTVVHLTSKAPVGERDEPTTPGHAHDRGWLLEDHWPEVERVARRVYEWGHQRYKKMGYVLADTKLEMGIDINYSDEIKMIDEILTPDCSRIWRFRGDHTQGTPDSWDKDILRKYLARTGKDDLSAANQEDRKVIHQIAMRYLDIYESVMGVAFEAFEDLQEQRVCEERNWAELIDQIKSP